MATLQFGDTLRTNRLEQFESTILTAPKLRIMSGTMPANCAAADSGTLLCEMALPSDYMSAAAAGVKTKLGTWSGTGDAGAGAGTNAGYFRIKNTAGAITHCQGDITATGGGGAMTLDNINIASGQTVTVTTFTLTEGNA
jgi:hypothetical protein